MRWTRIVTGFAVITSMTACGPPAEWFKVKRSRTDFHSNVHQTEHKPSCATEDDTSVASAASVRHGEVNVERVFQRVVRRDCKGVLKNDQIETVSSPNASFYIETLNAGDHLTAEVNDRATCNTIIRPVSNGRIKFTVDTSPTLFYLHINKDKENYLDYQVTLCPEAGTCDKGAVVEKGTVILKVNYSEKTIPETQEITETCPQLPAS